MSKLSQKEAVYNAIVSVKGTSEFEGVAVNMSREERAMVNQILVEGFKAGTIELEKTFTDAELKTYVSGLQSNWLRKDKRLNGGIAYVPKNPGSRAGSGDAQLKALRALYSQVTDPADRAEVQRHIDARTLELAAAKTATTVNYDALPEELRKKFSPASGSSTTSEE